MRRSLCSADMSNPNEQIVPKRTGKFVTFSEECDNHKKNYHEYLDTGIVFPKTKVHEDLVDVVFRKNWTPIRFPQAEEIINLPLPEDAEIISNDDCKPSSTLLEDRVKVERKLLRRKICIARSVKTNQMKEICKKLKRIHQLKQMDDLTALCKEKMSISTKETEKMDEDSSD